MTVKWRYAARADAPAAITILLLVTVASVLGGCDTVMGYGFYGVNELFFAHDQRDKVAGALVFPGTSGGGWPVEDRKSVV